MPTRALDERVPPILAGLVRLVRNLRWSWHEPTRELLRDLAGPSFPSGSRPLEWLAAIDGDRLEALAADPDVLSRVDAAVADLDAYLAAPTWYDGLDGPGANRPRSIAYFSPEFGVVPDLPQFTGGLGILAGDHLKTASDLGVPIVGVGLLYAAGYFRQGFAPDGWQVESFPRIDAGLSPLEVLREADGSRVLVEIGLPDGRDLRAQVWRLDVGRVPLLLLDTDIDENDEPGEGGDLRAVTFRLYADRGEGRLRQEMILGPGGVRALHAFSRITGRPEPEFFHMNEGHAGFLGIELVRERIAQTGESFAAALEATRPHLLFTTHTPVVAGIDRYDADLVRRYVKTPEWTGPAPEDVLALGRESTSSCFNMAHLGLRVAGAANAVSLLNGEVAREMFREVWPDADAVPIGSVTNGVHRPTWVRPRMANAMAGLAAVAPDSREFADAAREAWTAKGEARRTLVDDARARVRASYLSRGARADELDWVDTALDPDALTIGFARRAATYKRLTLMLRRPARLRALLAGDPDRPVQIVVAGKAHPDDDGGKALLRDMIRFADHEDVRRRLVFLPEYDMTMAATLFPGCDVWLNTPVRPYEACGTSGMKAALNGAFNLSIADGWWAEWGGDEVGWNIPTAPGEADGENGDEARDEAEADSLFDILERKVVPLFYDRGDDGLPRSWLVKLGRSVAELTPKVDAETMVRTYATTYYARPLAGDSLTG